MSYITIDNINGINAELSNYCNAACPMCARFNFKLELRKDVTNTSHTSLNLIKDKIGSTIIKRLKRFYSCGTYGDGSMNPECLEIYEHLRKNNNTCQLELFTNGGARNLEFWAELAKIGVEVLFHIDGLEDTNHLYRRNVKWDKLMANAQSYIQAGGKAGWHMFSFKHNQHQITKLDLKEVLDKTLVLMMILVVLVKELFLLPVLALAVMMMPLAGQAQMLIKHQAMMLEQPVLVDMLVILNKLLLPKYKLEPYLLMAAIK